MPNKTPRTKKQKADAVHTVMKEFKGGELHSGSKSGPKVKNRDQAVAIAMSESNQSGPSTPEPLQQPGRGIPHNFRASAPNSHGYGHPVTQRTGHLRNSGHSGAHRIGKR